MRMVGYYHPRGDGSEGAKRFKEQFALAEMFYLPLSDGQPLPVGTRATFIKGFESTDVPKMSMTFEVVGHRWDDEYPDVIIHDLKACDVAGLIREDCTAAVVKWLKVHRTVMPQD